MAKNDPRLDPRAWGGSEAGRPARIGNEEIALMDQERKRRVSTLLYGAPCEVYAQDGEWSLLAGTHDQYLGWAHRAVFLPDEEISKRRIMTAASFEFPEPDIKSIPRSTLPMGAWVDDHGSEGEFMATREGFIFAQHLEASGDAVDFAVKLLETPYLWGGGSYRGIDCSGLTQICYGVTGKDLPRDTDQQEANLALIKPEARKRGDLVYWKGHVGILEDEDVMIHATAFAMKTIREDLNRAISRIGDPTSFRRVI